ncbi:GGDEF domain-containing protein [Curvivirga aplysinae]|uniref:GGDEF domain-containing protein n=1 Tax=Curvivirga aplysinae TaxID=2529852 RepID=UPI0012BC4053|nr:GGDEF domain-containing protein [Curvivirga aplysinae]MTI09012.1 GGDEF domain-containing protein [Curvivirga aplysinae]
MENVDHQAFLNGIKRQIKYAFQPIVDIHTGTTYGYEALLRGQDELGFGSIQDFFDHAWNKGILHQADVILRQKALHGFAGINGSENMRLFFNMDGRTFESPDYHPDSTATLLKTYNLPRDSLCLEMSELYNNSEAKHITDILARCRQQNFRLALDDYGRGFSELKMLYDYQPDYLKIDRFFIDGLAEDQKKRLLVSNMVNMSHALGIHVIAEGVERVQDFNFCRELGCDLVQGYLISRPQLDHDKVKTYYPIITKLNNDDRRNRKQIASNVEEHLEHQNTVIREYDQIQDVLEMFKNNPDRIFFPVVDEKGEARGILRESVLKGYIYNRFGHALLNNRGIGHRVIDFITRCPIADIDQSLDEILHIYATNDIPEGIMISRNFKYLGFLSNHSLLQIINERRLVQAQDQNPLTKLPGNNSINDFVGKILNTQSTGTHGLAYFDFNNFKPFNDHYGFRQGDRAILLFADIMKKHLVQEGAFLGHVGGDDFFAGFSDKDQETVLLKVRKVLTSFNQDVESFYAKEDREKGYILAKDRDGLFRKFAMLSCAAAVLMLPASASIEQMDQIGEKLAYLKKQAKNAAGFVAYDQLEPQKKAKVELLHK